MKEAAGEANLTVITIVLIALVLGVGTIVVNRALKTTNESACCTEMGYYWHNGSCYTSQSTTTGSYSGVYTGDLSKDCG